MVFLFLCEFIFSVGFIEQILQESRIESGMVRT